ncbi:hypothetical protein OVA07_01170 [Novosphingobium sp. SL115]|uniref:hypothetical protein n=1 Tax=Novosphingobium sp. SL115 TaxID=2995150 RepID=UPI00227595B8|nr:hypothetical protein [Novosphingobium sp. SL115]MCY1669623.1 hypothetical protein [Novosphingobium sp. SL115]
MFESKSGVELSEGSALNSMRCGDYNLDRLSLDVMRWRQRGSSMLHGAITPETVFHPVMALRNPGSPADNAEAETEQSRYKRLINSELSRQAIPLAHMADRLGLLRTKLHKVLRQGAFLSDQLRDQLFEQLEIDHTRATIAVTMLKSDVAYHDPAVFLAAEGLKGLYCEAASGRRGEIQVDLRPVIIHTALGKTYEMLLTHQERVLEADRTLLS